MKEAEAEEVTKEIHRMNKEGSILLALTVILTLLLLFIGLKYSLNQLIDLTTPFLMGVVVVVGLGAAGALVLMAFYAKMKLAEDKPIIFSRKEKLQYMVIMWITITICVTVLPYLLLKFFPNI